MGNPKHFLSSTWIQRYRLKHYLVDSILVLGGMAAVTALVFLLHIYSMISDSVLFYLITILAFASFRGPYAAICASCVAFLAFDYFFVPPIYGLFTNKIEDILALTIFLLTAITTSQLSWVLHKRADDANRRERETHILYELVRATNSEEDMYYQFHIFARSLVEVFSPLGICDCMVLLPEKDGMLLPRTSAQQPHLTLTLSPDEESAARWVKEHACTADLWNGSLFPRKSLDSTEQFHAQIQTSRTKLRDKMRNYIRLVPLKAGNQVIGVLHLRIGNEPAPRSSAHRLGIEQERPLQQAVFFSTFLEQAVTVIQRGHLHKESLRIEVLERTDALRASLLSSVSHDLRTPLAGIKASATSLRQKELSWDQDALVDFATNIEREADRLNRLVANLLDMSRIEGGALSPEKVWYPLDELFHDVLSHMEGQLQGRTIRTQIPDDLPPVKLDYVQIDQVITNLIENALRYTPANSPIDVDIQLHQAQIVVEIADRGPGIAQIDREHIFDKFYRVPGEQPGVGLGLAVCRGLVEAHEGQIWVEAREGGGSVFSFTLPWEPLESNE